MTKSFFPLRGALRVLSASALIGTTGMMAAPAYAAGSGFSDSVRGVVEAASRGDRSRDGDRSRNRDTRSRDRNRDRDTRSRDRNRDRSHSRDRNRHDSRSYSRNRNYYSNRSHRNTRDRGWTTRHRNSYNAPTGWNSARYSSPWSTFTGRHKYRTNYRSGLGISFSFGSPGYSRYRWAPTRHSFYRPSFGSYSHYTRRTTCRPILLDAMHYGRYVTVEVTECSNPWDGTYIIQGSEKIVSRRY